MRSRRRPSRGGFSAPVAERADAFSKSMLGCKPVLSSSRLILSLKRLDRWREVPRCFQEFEQPTALLASYLGQSDIAMPTVAQHCSGLRLQVNEFGGFTVRQHAGAPGEAYGILHCEQRN